MSSTAATRPEASHDGFVRARVIAAGAALAVLGVSYVYAPYVHDGPVLCLLRGLAGIPCPSCGLTRAFCALSHFELHEALRYHALSPLLFAAVVATPFVAGYEIATRRPVSRPWLFSSKLAWALAALFLINHAARTAGWLSDFSVLASYFRDSWSYALLTFLRL